MNYTDLKIAIQHFNADNIAALFRERYATESFFDVIDKSRSETTHSAFVAWLLGNMSVGSAVEDKPIVRFLNLLVDRAGKQGINMDDQNGIADRTSSIENAILSHKLKINSVSAYTEFPISSLAETALSDYVTDTSKYNLLLDIAAKVQDRADIVLNCEVAGVSPISTLQIIIENKIDSKEGDSKQKTNVREYDKLTQTGRYYLASKRKCSSQVQLYVFLAPDKVAVKCADAHYIRVSYQDILDGIIEPLLMSQSLPPRTKIYLEEYKSEITFPCLTDDSYCPSLASARWEYSDSLDVLWGKIRPLVFYALANDNNIRLWNINGRYYQDLCLAKIAVLRLLEQKEKEWLIQNNFISPVAQEGWLQVGESEFWVNTRKSLAINRLSQYDVPAEEINPVNFEEDARSLLYDFWDNNAIFIAAIASSSENAVATGDYDLLNAFLQKRDTSKFYVYSNGQKQNEKAAGKGETAFLIIKAWVDFMKSHKEVVNLETVREYFPLKISNYYGSAKYFTHLVYSYNENNEYQYDSKDHFGELVNGSWDFYYDNNHYIELSGDKVTVLKMWRKDDLEKLIKHVESTMDDFSKQLKIIRA